MPTTPTTDIRQWLADIGLAQYADAFAAQAVDADVLPDLTDADLRALGVSLLGHRKRLLKAIADLGTGAPAVERPTSAPDPTLQTRPPEPEAERRQITVMFCDLVGSTALSGKLDPEDLRVLIRVYHSAVADVVTPYEGRVAQFLGDGVLVYFGYPRAHEDDAVRAVRAALDVIKSVDRLEAHDDVRLRTRIGIATGPVVVGQIGAGTSAAEISATGETPNLAARLQGLAEPGEIVVSPETRRLIGASFELNSLGARSLKGIQKPVEPWSVRGERVTTSRFEAKHPAHEIGPMMGREEEMTRLRERWAMARQGEAQVVSLSGEAGIGKSRLSLALRERVSSGGGAVLIWQCSPDSTSTALYPVAQQLARGAAFVVGDDLATRASKLAKALAATGLGPEGIGHLQRLLGLADGGKLPPALSPAQEKAATLQALTEAMAGLARLQPVLLVVEDAHWIDPTTEELLERAIEALRQSRVLMLITFRPQYRPNWDRIGQPTALTLGRLGQSECAALVGAVVHGKRLPGEVIDAIVQKTDGVPLFIEELTKAVVESGLLQESSTGYELNGSVRSLAIPSTLRDSLMARLDNLPSAKALAQAGAVVGREFSRRLLSAALDWMPNEQLNEALDDLVRSELVLQRGAGDEATYTFKHALIRDTAYGSMVRGQRSALHAAIAAALVSSDSETEKIRPELLAYHHQEAGDRARAREYWTMAADRSAREAAYLEAAEQYRAALALLDDQSESQQRAETELKIRMRMGNALAQTEGFSSAKMRECFVRAGELAASLRDPNAYIAAAAAIGGTLIASGRLNEVHRLFDSVDPEFRERMGLRGKVTSDSITSVARVLQGEHARAWKDLSRARVGLRHELSSNTRTPGLAFRAVNTLSYATLSAICQGRLGDAVELAEESMQCAAQDPPGATRVYALLIRGTVLLTVREMESAEAVLTEALEMSERHRVRPYTIRSRIGLARAVIARGDARGGVDLFREGIHEWHSEQGSFHCTELCAGFADELFRSSRPEAAIEFIEFGETVQRETDERLAESELLRLRGRLFDLDGQHQHAIENFELARGIACAQGAGLFELRAATDLAHTLTRIGRTSEAVQVLSPVCAGTPVFPQHPEVRMATEVLAVARGA